MSDKLNNAGALSNSQLEATIRVACKARFGSLDTSFLCQTVSALNPRTPICVTRKDSIEAVVLQLRSNAVGCVLITESDGKLCGIFSERDLVLKVLGTSSDVMSHPVERYMTADPVAEGPEITVAFALNLMSLGGFRHLPIVDEKRLPVGLLSVKDVVDYLVIRMTEDLLNFSGQGIEV